MKSIQVAGPSTILLTITTAAESLLTISFLFFSFLYRVQPGSHQQVKVDPEAVNQPTTDLSGMTGFRIQNDMFLDTIAKLIRESQKCWFQKCQILL